MAKIGLWSDAVNHPNLPLMKISAYHKSLGDTVELMQPMNSYDKCYVSKTFNLPLRTNIPQEEPWVNCDCIERGGTGYAIEVVDGKEVFHCELDKPLPSVIEGQYPDYDLYDEFKDTAYGFLTRGCCNACSFCIVSKKEGRTSHKVADVKDICGGQKDIVLLDPNILACKDRDDLLKQLAETKSFVDFNQGLDARFIDDDVSKLIAQVKCRKVHFAFDFMKNEKAIIRGLETFKKYHKFTYLPYCYELFNYDTTNEEDWYRARKIVEAGYNPYIMIYQKGTHNQFLTDLSRWCNNPFIFKSCKFEDYVPRKDGKRCGELYKDILKV